MVKLTELLLAYKVLASRKVEGKKGVRVALTVVAIELVGG